MYKLSSLVVGLLIALCADAQKDISVEKIFGQRLFAPKNVRQFHAMNDGEHYTYVTESKLLVKHKITQYEVPSDTILDLNTLFVGDKKLYVNDVQFNEDETKLLLITDMQYVYRHSFEASYYVYDLSNNTLQAVSSLHDRMALATFSPDGKFVAYVADNNLHLSNLTTQEIVSVSTDGEKNKIINGATDWVYEEEFGLVRGFCWSPDSKHLAFLKFDETHVREFSMEYTVGELYPITQRYKYPKAGEKNSVVSLHLYSIEGQQSHQLLSSEEIENDEYIPRLYFSPFNSFKR